MQRTCLLLIVILIASSFSYERLLKEPANRDTSTFDSLVIENYKEEIKKQYVENPDSITKEQVDSIFNLDRRIFGQCNVVYSNDKTFKIFTIEVESCGAYCGSEWFSWIHYNLNDVERTKKVNIGVIDSIYKLPDNKYLIISKTWGRPTSASFVHCICTDLISFSKETLISHPIKYKSEKNFSFCDENSPESQTVEFINYDGTQKKLSYSYTYKGVDGIDYLKEGYFKYIAGRFVLKSEYSFFKF